MRVNEGAGYCFIESDGTDSSSSNEEMELVQPPVGKKRKLPEEEQEVEIPDVEAGLFDFLGKSFLLTSQ